MRHPDWTRNAAIYQLNQRQLTEEGTFRAAEAELPRIRDLGVEIVWLMPVHPIGEVNRKGGLGSPYAVRDYLAVNPEFGTEEDLRHFVATAHGLGLKVILDWVANHTAWDNDLTRRHPEWYARDWKGDFRPTPWWDWDDIIDLDYDQPGLREYMAEALEYWVRECDVDGYRCDVAGFVPLDFWEDVRARLDAIKPVFMLAEWETRDLHARAFDASYAWSWNEALHELASGHGDLDGLRAYYAWNERSWPGDAMRMTFVSNHDHNHALGTEYERFGPALAATTVLSVVGRGDPAGLHGAGARQPPPSGVLRQGRRQRGRPAPGRAVPPPVRAEEGDPGPVERRLGRAHGPRAQRRREPRAQLRADRGAEPGVRGVQPERGEPGGGLLGGPAAGRLPGRVRRRGGDGHARHPVRPGAVGAGGCSSPEPATRRRTPVAGARRTPACPRPRRPCAAARSGRSAPAPGRPRAVPGSPR